MTGETKKRTRSRVRTMPTTVATTMAAATAVRQDKLIDAMAASGGPQIHVLSNRSDLISAGDALVAIDLPRGSDPKVVRVSLNGRDVTGARTGVDRDAQPLRQGCRALA